MKKENPLLRLDQIIKEEDRHLKQRRSQLRGEKAAADLEKKRFGIAMSGGGIRSATINLGLLRTLNKFKILEKSDYLSTVSGGGYTGAYIQATLKKEESYEGLFKESHINYMRSRGEYMTPGTGGSKLWSTLVLITGYLVSTLMSLLGPFIVIFLAVAILAIIGELTEIKLVEPATAFIKNKQLLRLGIGGVCLIFTIHFFSNLYFKFHLGASRIFNRIESVLILGVLLIISVISLLKLVSLNLDFFDGWGIETNTKLLIYITFAFVVIVLGFFTNPNALSFHRYYRNQLAEAFLNYAKPFQNITLRKLFDGFGEKRDYIAPYPIINTCLNLQAMGGGDANFKGVKASDYFLLTPLHFGSKLTKYVSTTHFKDYKEMTLPAATTISAAAVNPGMGMYSNKALSVLMTIFNARLGFWVSNPLKQADSWVWWPTYFFKELFSQIGTSNQKLNISDGGHIENLGVYELLRRQCRLILAIDAGADPSYGFNDLENLTVRARNELGLEIEFRAGQIPEDTIRPKPSHGYSQKRFAVADVFFIWDEIPSIDKSGNVIKDRDNKLFEVVINYSDLKESMKDLDFEAKLLVKIIFRIITTYKASGLLQMQMKHLQIEDEEKVKNLIQKEIFSGGTNERTESVKQVILDALQHEPDQMRYLLKQAKLLPAHHDNQVKLTDEEINKLIEALDGSIANIEQVLLDELTGKIEISKVYSVIQRFLDLLDGVKSGLENKVITEVLLRKVEDQFTKKILISKGLQEADIDAFFKEDPTDSELWEWLVLQGLSKSVIADWTNERNNVRKLLKKYSSEQELKVKLLGFRLDEVSEESVLALGQINRILSTMDNVTVLEEWLKRIFVEADLPESLASDLIVYKYKQENQVEALMEVVTEKIEERVRRDIRMGTLVYVKSSVKAPLGKIVTDDELKYSVYKYKIYHPDFPHESTADQFFDKVQWESYYKLGQYLGGEVLGISGLDDYFERRKVGVDCSIEDLIYRFDNDDTDADILKYNGATQTGSPFEEAMPNIVLERSMPKSRGVVEAEPVVQDSIPDAVPEIVPEEEVATEPKEQIQEKVVAGKKIDYTI